MNGFLLVAVCNENDVPLRLYDEHGRHAATVEADACDQSPERVKQRYQRAFQAVVYWQAEAPRAFRVLQIEGGEVVECVYDTGDVLPVAECDSDHD